MVKLTMQVGITLVAIISGIWILQSDHYDATLKHTASGWMGAAFGYWLK